MSICLCDHTYMPCPKCFPPTHPQNMVPDGGATKVDVEVGVAVTHTHQAILLYHGPRQHTDQVGEGVAGGQVYTYNYMPININSLK